MFLLKDMKDFVSATNLLLRGSEISFQGFRMIEDSWKANLKLGLNDWLYLLNWNFLNIYFVLLQAAPPETQQIIFLKKMFKN